MPLLQLAQGNLSSLIGQHQLLLTALLHLGPQGLIGARFGAVFLQSLARDVELLLHDPAAFLTLLHVIELAPRLLDPGVEQGHACKFIDQPAAIAVAHRNDAGDVPLHHDVAAFRIDAQPAQLGLQLLQIAGFTVGGVAAGVGATRHHPQFSRDRPLGLISLDPGAFFRRFNPLLCGIRLPVAEIEAHAHVRFCSFPCFEDAAVHQVGEPVGAHPPAAGQAQAEENAIKNVALA